MYTLVKPFIELALFRRSPQQLPESTLLLWLVLSAHALLGVLLFAHRFPVGEALVAGVAGTAILCALTVSLLAINRLRSRLIRTLTALAGVDVVIGLLALPISGWLQHAMTGGATDGVAAMLFLCLLVWNLGAAGNVLRHALSAPLGMGLVLALIFYVVTVSVMNNLFPGPA